MPYCDAAIVTRNLHNAFNVWGGGVTSRPVLIALFDIFGGHNLISQ